MYPAIVHWALEAFDMIYLSTRHYTKSAGCKQRWMIFSCIYKQISLTAPDVRTVVSIIDLPDDPTSDVTTYTDAVTAHMCKRCSADCHG